MNALPFQCVEIRREGGDEGFSLARDHFGDPAGMEDDASHQLDVVMPHLQGPAARFAAGGERLGEEVVKRLPLFEPSAELRRLRLEFVRGEGLHRRFERVDLLDRQAHLANLPLVRVSEETDQPRRHTLRNRSERVGRLVPNLAEQFHCQIRLKT